MLTAMWNPFRIECPVSAQEKAWVESEFVWMRQEFGPEPLTRTPLVPTARIFPHEWDGGRQQATELFSQLCRFMMVRPERARLRVYSEGHSSDVPVGQTEWRSGAAGLYWGKSDNGVYPIGVEETILARPPEFVATVVHELSHVVLLGGQRIDPARPDMEPLTDLFTIFAGAGIFTANAAYQFQQWTSQSHQGWSANRQGYLSEPLLGYALGCYAWWRGEAAPPWSEFLEPNIRPYLRKTLRFLKSEETVALGFGAA